MFFKWRNKAGYKDINLDDIKKYHRLSPKDEMISEILKNPNKIGLTEEDLSGKSGRQRDEFIIGEYFAKLSAAAGKVASEYLLRSQWSHGSPRWFDHRHHLLDPEKQFSDNWTVSADNAMKVLPLNGKILDMCSGDGFYDYYFYRKRASEVICVEFDEAAYRQAIRLHTAPNIIYELANLLEYEAKTSYFDTVLLRGAIEQFSAENQLAIFRKALKALKVGGWFCGDTPANEKVKEKLLCYNQHEWADEGELQEDLKKVFEHVETDTMHSTGRTTLFWRCKRTK